MGRPIEAATLHEGPLDMVAYFQPGAEGKLVVTATFAAHGAEGEPMRVILALADGDDVAFAMPGFLEAVYRFARAGDVMVNGRRVSISSIRLRVGDVVEVKEKSKELPILLEALQLGERDVPDYVEADHKRMTAKLARVPGFSDVPYPVQMDPALVIEFYSR